MDDYDTIIKKSHGIGWSALSQKKKKKKKNKGHDTNA